MVALHCTVSPKGEYIVIKKFFDPLNPESGDYTGCSSVAELEGLGFVVLNYTKDSYPPPIFTNYREIVTPNGEIKYEETYTASAEGADISNVILFKRISVLEQQNQSLMLALAESIEQQQTDKIAMQVAMAEIIETVMGGGV